MKCIQIRHCRYVQKYFLVFKQYQLCHVSFAVNRMLQNQSNDAFSIKKHNTQHNSVLLKNNLKYRTIPSGRKAISVVHSVNTQVECCSPGLFFSMEKMRFLGPTPLQHKIPPAAAMGKVRACGGRTLKRPPSTALIPCLAREPGNMAALCDDVMFCDTADLKTGRLSQWA